MKINIYYESGSDVWCYLASFSEIHKKLLIKYPDIEFNHTHSLYMRSNGKYLGPSSKYGPHYMIIENDDNKKYILLSYWDKLYDVTLSGSVTNWDVENCVQIITSSGVHKNDIHYQSLNHPYSPFSYVCSTMENELLIEKLYEQKTERIYPDKLAFRGYLYLFRKYLKGDNRFIINSVHDSYLYPQEYMKELDTSHLNFSINGAGEICYRDMEIMGLGTTLFRTKLTTKFHNELIPNYHYISVDLDEVEIPENVHDHNTYWKSLSDKIYDRFEEIKNDHDYIKFVGENGRKWYLENGTVMSNSNIGIDVIDINKLK